MTSLAGHNGTGLTKAWCDSTCMRLDHIVLWTKDPRAAMDFYSRVVGLAPVRFAEFEAGEAPFPSVRVCEDSIIDLIAGRKALPAPSR